MAQSPSRFIAVLLMGGLALALSFFVMRIKSPVFLISSTLAGMVVGGVVSRKKKDSSAGTLIADGLTKLDYDAGLKAAWAHHRTLSNDAFKITNPAQKKRVEAIIDVVGRILKDIKEDPKDFKAARQFLEYYLGATVKVVHHYVELGEKGQGDPEIKESLAKVEETLDSIRDAFEKQLRLLLENDKLDLDVELSVLKKTIEFEGLGPSPSKKP